MTKKHANSLRWGLCALIGTAACEATERSGESRVSEESVITATALTTADTPWRTANWNICQTALSDPGTRPECRAMINPTDSSRTASEVERRAIGDRLLQPDMYSFSLQEVCEQDVRWIAAYVANNGKVRGDGTFSARQYFAIDTLAPYAFLPYLTREIMGATADHGCGPGVSTGIGVITKSDAGAPAPIIHGLSNATYGQRLAVPFTYAELQSSACPFYFEAQVNRKAPQFQLQFRTNGCQPLVNLDTLRGLACVQTSWRASRSATSLTRATSCASHMINRGEPHLDLVADRQLEAVSKESIAFSNNGPLMLGADFNYTQTREALEGMTPALRKVTQGPTHRFRCASEIDAIYVRGWNFSAPRTTNCERIDLITDVNDLHFGDFDGDQRTDVFHRQESGQWRFSSGGDGPWQYLNQSAAPGNELAFGYFDNDDRTDVFHRNSNGQWRYSSGGVGSWINLNHSLVPGNELAFGDFDGDGRTDVFHRHSTGQWRYSSAGVARWLNANQSAVPGNELAFHDFDGDSRTDVFHRHSTGQWRYSAGGVAAWQNLNQSGAPGNKLGFGDFDNDGRTDVFYSDKGQWLYSRDGIASWEKINDAGAPFEELRFHDFTGDGKTDVFWATDSGVWKYSDGGRLGWQVLGSAIAPLDPADPFSWSDHALTESPALTLAPRTKSDFNGDGVSDVFYREPTGQWWYSASGLDSWRALNGSGAPTDELDIGDFDGDRVADIFHRDSSGQWRFSSGGVAAWRNLNRSAVPGHELRFGDFDGDGVTDVFHRHSNGQWRFSSGGVANWRNLNRSSVPGTELAFGDFDGDGVTDVFHRHSSGQWRYSKGGVARWQNLNSSAVPGHELRFDDFDGDGATDVFHRASNGQWRYSKSGTASWKNINRSSAPGHELRFGDFNGDGVTDVFDRESTGQWRYSRSGVQSWEDLNQSRAPLNTLLFEP